MGLHDKLKSFAGKMLSNRPIIDPSRFDDPVALTTKWLPAKRGGANFKTHKLYEVDFDRLEFKATAGARILCLIFLLVGLGVMFVPPIVSIIKGKPIWAGFETIFLLLFGLIFALAGGGLLYYLSAPVIFDKRIGYFWKGWKSPDQVVNIDSIKHVTMLDNIHAIQLLSEYCRGEGSNYYSYELNLVLKDASRIHVVDHGKRLDVIYDASKLADFLGVPVWNAID